MPRKRLKSKPPYVIGMTGGIASGKSSVSEAFSAAGAAVVDADRIAHDVLTRPLVTRRLVQLFGEEILDAQQKIDRAKLGRIVFEHPDHDKMRTLLESVVHPIIHAAAVQELRAHKEAEPPPRAIIVDAPLLLEAGWAPMCDAIVFVEASEAARVRRACQRGWSEEHFLQRQQAQLSVGEKRARAGYTISGEIPRESLNARAAELLETILTAIELR